MSCPLVNSIINGNKYIIKYHYIAFTGRFITVSTPDNQGSLLDIMSIPYKIFSKSSELQDIIGQLMSTEQHFEFVEHMTAYNEYLDENSYLT